MMDPIEGVDYSTDRPDPAGLAAVGKRFACRYGGPGSAGKQLTRSEAEALTAHGVSIVAGAEGTERGLSGGYRIGAEWARSAHTHYVGCGMPASRPIYLAADWDVKADEWPAVRQALEGAASVLGADRVGLYGGYNAIAWAVRDNAAHWLWQTYAWSAGRWHPRAHLRQYRNHVSLVGGTVDLDHAMFTDYGQWTVGGTVPEEGAGDMTPEQAKTLENILFVLTMCVGPDGQEGRQINHWTGDTNTRLSNLDEKLSALLDAEEAPTSGGTDIGGMLSELRDAVRELLNAPLVDPVAVATAFASHPEISRTLAAQVAAQLATIQGSITLTGSLSGGIAPPAE